MKTSTRIAATAALKIALAPALRDQQQKALAEMVLAASTRFDWRTIATTAMSRRRLDVAAIALAMVADDFAMAAALVSAADSHSGAKLAAILAA